MSPPAFLRALLEEALRAATPQPAWFEGLVPPTGRTIVIGAGKAAASMAQAFEESWDGPLEGLVVTRYGHAVPTKQVEVVEAGHPIPDEAGLEAAMRILSLARSATRDDLVVALVSGGGSSLLTLPAPGISLEDKQHITHQLLMCGASIREINSVRRRLSAVKGGQLLEECGHARVATFVLSDVPGDDPSMVASGPTVRVTGSTEMPMDVVERYGIKVSGRVASRLQASPSEPRIRNEQTTVQVVASAAHSLAAAAIAAERMGIHPFILSDAIEGEAREVAKVLGAIALSCANRKTPFTLPCVLLSGGETTVTVKGTGVGGRNVEFLASLAQVIGGHPKIYALAADTDGVDGALATAGATIDPTIGFRAGDRLATALAENDAHSLFKFLGDDIVTGPTFTNVNDFRAILIHQ